MKSRAADGAPMMAAMAAPEPAVTVRSNFSATAFWQPGIVTDEEGGATVHFKYPDSLTTWRAVVRGATAGAEFGFAKAATRTTKRSGTTKRARAGAKNCRYEEKNEG